MDVLMWLKNIEVLIWLENLSTSADFFSPPLVYMNCALYNLNLLIFKACIRNARNIVGDIGNDAPFE